MANLEHQLEMVIGFLIGNDLELNARITASELASNLITLFDVLFRYRVSNETSLIEFTKLIKDLGEINRKRNQNIHASWLLWEIDGKPIINKYRTSKKKLGEFIIDRKAPTLETLTQIADRIDDLTGKVFTIMYYNRAEIMEHKKLNITRPPDDPLSLT